MAKGKKRKVRIEMSVELYTLMDKKNDEESQLAQIAKAYSSCFGDKDIKIENVRFLN